MMKGVNSSMMYLKLANIVKTFVNVMMYPYPEQKFENE
jgi:hypothetical protein